MDQPGKVANPACGQLNRENEYFPVRVLRASEFVLARRVRHSRPASACSSPYSGWIWCLLTGFLPSSAAAVIIQSINQSNVCTLCRYFQHAHFIQIVGVGKRGAYYLVHGDLPRQHSLGTTLMFTGPAPADSRQNARGTQLRDPINSGLTRWRMVILNKEKDATTELGRNPVSKHQIQPEYGDEQADAGRDRRTRLVRPNSQARRTRTGEYSFSRFS